MLTYPSDFQGAYGKVFLERVRLLLETFTSDEQKNTLKRAFEWEIAEDMTKLKSLAA